MAERYLNYNGKFINALEPVLHSANRSFRYGDSLFETIRVVGRNIQFLDDHMNRLKSGMNILKMEIPSDYTTEQFFQQINLLIWENGIQSDARVRLTVFRNDGGFYTPLSNQVSYLIEIEAMEEVGYVLNQKGYTIDIFSEIKKAQGMLSSVKSANSLLYVLAGIYKTENKLDDCVVLNTKGNISEGISSNLFVVKNGALYTPLLEEGCIEGVMRKQIFKIARDNRIAVHEVPLAVNVLLNSDEVFLTNAIQGIRWVGAYKGKRYFNTTSKLLNEKLNAGLLIQ